MKTFRKTMIGAFMLALVFMLAAPQAMAAYHVKKIETRMPALITAGETLTTGEVVCIKDADGYAYKADASDSALRPAVGVIGKGGSSGSYVEIITRGKMAGWSSLAEGQPGYLSETPGAVTQSAPTSLQQQVAVAVSTTEYLFDFSAKMDPELMALAGLTSAANKIPYFTGSGTAGLVASSANVVSWLASADYSTARTNLGVAIGTNVQAYDADLDTFATLTPTADAQTLLESTNFASMTQDLSLEIGVDTQAYDADLDTFATLTPTADAQTLLESTNFASMAQDLSLEIGVDTQAYDADLDTYAGITPTASVQIALGNANNSVLLSHRHRVTVAEINADHELLPAISGKSYRMVECLAIAYGGAVGTTTTVDILGTQSAGSVKLVAYAQAGLTQSSVLVSGGTNAAVTADGASYVACDAASAITINKTGGDADTATGVDIILTYVIE